MVPCQSPSVPKRVEQRHLGVGEMPAYHQDNCMSGQEGVQQRRQRETAKRSQNQTQPEKNRRDLENPREIVMWTNRRPEQTHHNDYQEQKLVLVPGYLHRRATVCNTLPSNDK